MSTQTHQYCPKCKNRVNVIHHRTKYGVDWNYIPHDTRYCKTDKIYFFADGANIQIFDAYEGCPTCNKPFNTVNHRFLEQYDPRKIKELVVNAETGVEEMVERYESKSKLSYEKHALKYCKFDKIYFMIARNPRNEMKLSDLLDTGNDDKTPAPKAKITDKVVPASTKIHTEAELDELTGDDLLDIVVKAGITGWKRTDTVPTLKAMIIEHQNKDTVAMASA